MGARYTSNLSSKVVPQKVKELESSALKMATNVHRRAVLLAPVDTSALRNSGRIEKLSMAAFRVIFGGGRVPYARRRHFENNKNPQTVRFLYRAGNSVKRESVRKYIGSK